MDAELNICLQHICNQCFKLLLAVSDIQHECEKTDAIFMNYLNSLKNKGKQYAKYKGIIKNNTFNDYDVSVINEDSIKIENYKQISFACNNMKETSELINVNFNEFQQISNVMIKQEAEDALIEKECDEDNNCASNIEQNNSSLDSKTTKDEFIYCNDFKKEYFQDDGHQKEIINERNVEQNMEIKIEEHTIDWQIKNDMDQHYDSLSNQNKNCLQTTQGCEVSISEQSIEDAFDEKDSKKPKLEQNSYICDVCNKAFTRRDNLIRHKRIHSGERPFECDICNKRFTVKGNLSTHKLIHFGERTFECDICHKKFLLKHSLTQHILIHTGERAFECDICNKKFMRKGNLTQHKLVHTGERPFECDVCNKGFTDKRSLIMHKCVHIGERSFGCDVCNKRLHKSVI